MELNVRKNLNFLLAILFLYLTTSVTCQTIKIISSTDKNIQLNKPFTLSCLLSSFTPEGKAYKVFIQFSNSRTSPVFNVVGQFSVDGE